MPYISNEERWFSFYLDELLEAGYVKKYIPQPEGYLLADTVSYQYEKQLKTKQKTITTTLLQRHHYTPDFKIIWSLNAWDIFFNTKRDRKHLKTVPFVGMKEGSVFFSIIEVKAGFSKFNMGREATLHQKWVMEKYGHYVQRIVISNKTGLFKNTFTPQRCLKTDKSGKDRKLYFKPKTLKEFVGA